MKTNTELLIQALETTPNGEGGICNHIRYSLEEPTPRINEIIEQFKKTAIVAMDYPLVALGFDCFLFPLDSEGNYQQPTYDKGGLTLDGIRAATYYAEQYEHPFEGELGATRLKLIKDVIKRLKSKVEIFVDSSNVHLLDGLIKQYNLSWGVQRERTLEDRPVYGNYLIIDLKDKSLMWSENRHYVLTTLQDLITTLDRPEFAHWEILDPKIEFMAKDSNGEWWGYPTEPNFEEGRWLSGGLPIGIRGLNPDIFPTCSAQNSLIRKDNA